MSKPKKKYPKYDSNSAEWTCVKYKSTYLSWRGMRKRCSGESPAHKERYCDRGITICKRWDKFENFLADMGERPKGLTLDRKDNNKGYSRSNCRWATQKEQNDNRSNSRLFTINGETKNVVEWAREYNVSKSTVYYRLYQGADIVKALGVKNEQA